MGTWALDESQVYMILGFLADVGSRRRGLWAVTWKPGHRRCWVGQSPNQAESLEPFTPHQLGLGWELHPALAQA